MGIKLVKEVGNHLYPSLGALEKTCRCFQLSLIADWYLSAAQEEPQDRADIQQENPYAHIWDRPHSLHHSQDTEPVLVSHLCLSFPMAGQDKAMPDHLMPLGDVLGDHHTDPIQSCCPRGRAHPHCLHPVPKNCLVIAGQLTAA